MKRNRRTAIICLLCCFQAPIALACRFTIREVGFVDLGAQQYVLYGYVDNDTAEAAPTIAQVAETAFLDSNLAVEVVNVDQQKSHVGREYLDLWPMKSFPGAVLVSPDGQSLPVFITKPNQPFKQAWESALGEIVSSPARVEILRHISEAFGVVLLIEGPNAQENAKARDVVSSTIEIVARELKRAPYPIAQPPVLVALDRKSFSREKILLWSLGLDADKVDKPHAAVLYGKARWIGPLMKGEEITEDHLLGILSVIAANCECGFDISWTRGTMLPIRWDQKMRARAAEALGFDPENPMVKMEVSGILRMDYFPSGVPFGYVELSAEPEGTSEPAETFSGEDKEGKQKAFPQPPPVKIVSEKPAESGSGPALRKPMYIFAGLAALVVIAGIVLFFRANARNL